MAAAPQMQISLRDMSLFRQQALVGGRWEDAASGQTKTVVNPANGRVIGTVPNLGAAETRRAIEAAGKALPDWRARSAKERAAVLRKWYDLMMANQEDLAVLMTVEQGKPLVESRGEIAYAAAFIEWFGEEGKRVYGDVIPGHARDKRIVVLKQPIGVTAAITPWNFPAAMIARKVGLAESLNLETGGRTDGVVLAERYVRGGRYEALAQRLAWPAGHAVALCRCRAVVAGLCRIAVRPRSRLGPNGLLRT